MSYLLSDARMSGKIVSEIERNGVNLIESISTNPFGHSCYCYWHQNKSLIEKSGFFINSSILYNPKIIATLMYL